MSRPRLIALLLALITLVVYLPAGRFGFVTFDDNDYVTENSPVNQGLTLAGFKWAFTSFHAGNWHPLTWISHMIDCSLFGLNPGAHHFVNVLIHAANVAILFVLWWRLTRKIWLAACIAALFGLHPLHVESVAWISERKDVLSTFFALVALLNYARYAQENIRGGYWRALFFFALGLLCKPMLVTLPCLLLLLDFWPLPTRANIWRLVREKIPFFALAMVSGLITFCAQRQGEAVASLERVPLVNRLENAPIAIASYLREFFWPARLCAIYPLPEIIPASHAIAAIVALGAISVFAWHWRSRRPYFLMGWLWFLITLLPVIGLVQVGGQSRADRYTYIPSIGIFVLTVFALDAVTKRIQMPKIILASFAVLIFVGCILVTEKQLVYWQNGETLFRRALAVTQNNSLAHLNLGTALAQLGRPEEALVEFRETLRLTPGRYQLHNNIGNILDDHGRPREAAAEYREAIRIAPQIPFLHNSLGVTLTELGQNEAARNEFAEAERLDPNYAWPHVETAKLFLGAGRDAEAVRELRTAVALDPVNYAILAYAARVLSANENAGARDGQTALALAAKANVLSDDRQPTVFDALGMACAETGDFTNAEICAQNALDDAIAMRLVSTNQIQRRLELYQHHQPWRESFLATNTPVMN